MTQSSSLELDAVKIADPTFKPREGDESPSSQEVGRWYRGNDTFTNLGSHR